MIGMSFRVKPCYRVVTCVFKHQQTTRPGDLGLEVKDETSVRPLVLEFWQLIFSVSIEDSASFCFSLGRKHQRNFFFNGFPQARGFVFMRIAAARASEEG